MGVKIDYQNKIIVPNAPNGNGKRQLDTIYFTAAGYVDYPIKGISRDSALGWEEPVWGGDLTRSTDFVLTIAFKRITISCTRNRAKEKIIFSSCII
mgnify:CR=1 FL=1